MKLQKAEQDRIFCNHTLTHFLDVARLTYIYSLEEQTAFDKEIIYAAALLHDLGRFEQIDRGTPHDQASAALAGRILPECGFSPQEIAAIQNAILHHRNHPSESPLPESPQSGGDVEALPYADRLAVWLYRADKQSRCCFACDAEAKCNWSREKKNLTLVL